ncbi:hypothetical protein [Qipengyuania sp. ASV99]|uniref:hypothetical protein n=1 Tax=Qipengyuania sp. ASV99 TaxID=3399681 RepID=UPI003A4C52BA
MTHTFDEDTAPTPNPTLAHALIAAPLEDGAGWTPARQATFLQALASTHSVANAARVAGMSRQSAYALRARLKGEPFDHAWTAALRCRFDALAEAAMERALNGVEVPHYHRGELIGTSRKYDERLTVALLMMRDSFRLPHARQHDVAARYGSDDFGRLVERVEAGPETWDEQDRQERIALYEEYARDAAAAEAEGDADEGDHDSDEEE